MSDRPPHRLARFWSRVTRGDPDACWPWAGAVNRDGYGYAKVRGRRVLVHRLAADADPGTVVRHACDNPLCCNPGHLVIGTHAENVADRVERNRSAAGSRNGRAKLTEEGVGELRRSLAAGESVAAAARRLGVDRTAVRKVRDGVTWRCSESGLRAANPAGTTGPPAADAAPAPGENPRETQGVLRATG